MTNTTPRRKRREKTIAITLRLSPSWATKLNDCARHLSVECSTGLNVQDLIRFAINEVFLKFEKRQIWRREGLLTKEDELKLWQSIASL